MPDVVLAVALGALSAVSLPLGAATARVWHPSDSVLGMLTAFGGGALLTAVTIGIVAPTVEDGQLGALIVGAVLGGLAFELLNRAVNARGGFLRKASTTLVYAQQRERQRRRRLLAHLERIDLFDGLPDRELDLLARAARPAHASAGTAIYRHGDPADDLHMILRGEVDLRHGADVERLQPPQAFGFRSFLAGTAHGSSATAAGEVDLLRISRPALEEVLEEAPTLRRRLQEELRGDAVRAYLRDEHGFGAERLADWIDRVDADAGHGTIRADHPPHPGAAFVAAAPDIRRVPVFAGLPEHEREFIAARLLRKRHGEGHVFFRAGDPPDRLYVLESGHVTLIGGPSGTARGAAPSVELGPHDAFGALSFFTGGPHATTAVAAGPVTVWVLRRSDLESLLEAAPEFRAAVRAFLGEEQVAAYLRQHQGIASPQVQRWVRTAMRSVNEARPTPQLRSAGEGHAAPLAIWLGLMLDGIPESFVVGAEATGVVGASLIAGLFLSNYPEALSSSIGMREQGTAWRRIAVMWLSLLVAAAIGAGIGAVALADAPEVVVAVVRGLTAGAMLTVISETMLPEAFARSGSLSGPAALAGFLVALVFGA